MIIVKETCQGKPTCVNGALSFFRAFALIVSNRCINVEVARQVKRENRSLPVAVCGSIVLVLAQANDTRGKRFGVPKRTI